MRSVQTENSVCPSKGLICGCPSFRGRWFFGQGQRQVDSQKDVHWEHLRSQAKSYNLDVFDAFPSIPFSCVSCLLLCTNHTLSPHTHTHTQLKNIISHNSADHMSLAGVLFLLMLLAGIAMVTKQDPMGSSQNRSHPHVLCLPFV